MLMMTTFFLLLHLVARCFKFTFQPPLVQDVVSRSGVATVNLLSAAAAVVVERRRFL